MLGIDAEGDHFKREEHSIFATGIQAADNCFLFSTSSYIDQSNRLQLPIYSDSFQMIAMVVCRNLTNTNTKLQTRK